MKKFLTLSDPVVPMYHPRVLVETAAAQGARVEEVLAGSDITPLMLSSPDARISYMQFGVITANALRLTGNPALGIDFGRRVEPSHNGMLGVAVTNSPNTGAALEVGLKYSRMVAPAWDLSLIVQENLAILRARELIPLKPFLVFATESLLWAIDNLVRCLLGRPSPIVELRLNYPKPDHFNRYSEITAPIFFDREVTESLFDPSWLNQPIRAGDPLTAQLAERFCASQMQTNVAVAGLVGEVRRLLRAASGNYPDPVELAKTLQTSSRSLRRGLQEMGTSYRDLLDEARRMHAIDYVLCTDMRAEQIAELLGFTDVRSFRRAFKRWTGKTLAAYRAAEGHHEIEP